MTMPSGRRCAAVLLACLLSLPCATAHAGGPGPGPSAADPLPALESAAHPLRGTDPATPTHDLRPLGRMIGDATVVGIGEAAHGSHDFPALRHRVFRHLVEEKGFRAFAMEVPWSTGVLLNDYLTTGRGDPRRILSDELQNAYLLFHNEAHLDLVHWMRRYNEAHPHDPVRFVGDDTGYAGPELYDRVVDHVRRAHPDLLPEFRRLYSGLRPTGPAGVHMREYLESPLAERREKARRTARALDLLRRHGPGRTADGGNAHTWAVRHADALDQVARQFAFDYADPEQVVAAMSYRDRAMARNTVWWHRHTGNRVLVGGHNGHVYLRSYDPDFPVVQGGELRKILGRDYLAVGVSFHQGSFHATDTGITNPVDEDVKLFSVGPAAPGTVEHTLDRVRHRDFYLDLRTVPEPARGWLDVPRPKREIGTDYPFPLEQVALRPSADVLVHLHTLTASRPLPRYSLRRPVDGPAPSPYPR